MATSATITPQQADVDMRDHLQPLAALPAWLSAIAQPDAVWSAFVHSIPELASGELRLVACEIKRVRLKERGWIALYHVEVADAPADQRRNLVLRGTLVPPHAPPPDRATAGAFGTETWRCYIPALRLLLQTEPPDAELPALPILTDPEQARALLEDSIRRDAPTYADITIDACTPRIMRYKPGSRCTILYELAYADRSAGERNWPEIVVAKTYHGDKGRNAYIGMRALWDSPLATGTTVQIAEPLAYLPAMNVLVQGPIREQQTLKELLRAALADGTPAAMEELHRYMRQTAIGLAALHCSGVREGALRVWEDELAEVRDVLLRLSSLAPQLNGVGEALLARLEALAAVHPADPPVPSHGTFRPAQVLLHENRIGFIDFDGFCQAEPALDIALFLGKIKDIGLGVAPGGAHDGDVGTMDRATLTERFAQLDALQSTFLTAYEARAPVSRQRIALWEALDLLTLVLHCWTKVKPVRLNNTLLLLHRYLRSDVAGSMPA